MKVLFSADWHIKLGQKNVPRDWQAARYRELFAKLHTLEKEVDVHIIGGDIFDKLPSIEELELFFEYVGQTTCQQVILFDGNHEATKKGHTFLHNLKYVCDILSNGTVDVLLKSQSWEGIDFIPYTELKTFDPEDFTNEILCTHVRGEIPPHVHPEIELSRLDGWKTVLAGDLHSYTNSQRNILYPGSPLTISFHRSPVRNGIIIFDTKSHSHDWIELGLPQLIRKTVTDPDDMVPTEYDHTIYELEGNMSDIGKVDRDNEFLDKTIVS
jgi:DNA repair exonuclease SbcCD nuclease subunit